MNELTDTKQSVPPAAVDRPPVSTHACWAYSSDENRSQAVTAWLAKGLRLGQRCVYVADAEPEALLAELAGVPDVTAVVRRGRLAVMTTRDLYDLSQPIDPPAQLAVYAGAVEEAVAAGYRGVRVAADITPLVADASRRASHLAWEQYADRYIAEHPLAPMCLYDTRRIDAIDAIDAIVCSHPIQGPAPYSFVVTDAGATRAVVAGEVDACRAAAFGAALAALPDSDQSIDASGLSFVDGHSAEVLQRELAQRRSLGRPLAVSAASLQLRQVWSLCGFDPSLLASVPA